jgi:enoyl-CoA hydratase
MSEGTIHLTAAAPSVAILEIDSPPTNALGSAVRKIFLERLDALERDSAVRAIVVTGKGRTFCSGDDLKERAAVLNSGTSDSTASFAQLLDRLETSRVPVIAAVNGWAAGGGLELALACDIRLAANEAQFVCAGVNVGLIASAWRLPRLIGPGRAKHMLLTGLPFDAMTAEKFGLVTGVHQAGDLLPAALVLAERIASRAPLSVEATKRIASRAVDLVPAEASRAVQAEFEALVKSADHAEALAAFREKREPKFTRS